MYTYSTNAVARLSHHKNLKIYGFDKFLLYDRLYLIFTGKVYFFVDCVKYFV